jgi:fumarate hydratase class II
LVSACLDGVGLNEKRIADLMLLTSLRLVIGWDESSKIAHEARDKLTTPKNSALKNG